ncbi:LacI family DNA-binding transcriptional regulator [Galactobacter caseinivorans]|uniref:LacI family transcriptional regulator n=1 Tax=Galactobacter caseinivorans TaxID=2676123 RepID=A0A496PM04_9MICC|nr:LacI family DNA-binding transcriptional regulator [Galactobacter caseinivorans]RKW71552.1 LacI family transcriptional regulator [Galactobacter caseinivorans]
MTGPHSTTIYAVAERAGVSISTVSLSLNHPHKVAQATRARVLAAVDALGYRAGAQRRSRTIAVAAPFSSSPSYYRRLEGILAEAAEPRIDVIIHDLPAANTLASPLLQVLPVREDIDGVILMGVPPSTEVEELSQRTGLPTVLVDVIGSALTTINGDDERGARLLGRHLRQLGHTEVVFVHEPLVSEDYVASGSLRWEGLVAELGAPRRLVADQQLVQHLGAATAIVASNDAIAAQVAGLLKAAGVRVPQDISLTGYDDGDLAKALDLTTVRQDFAESGKAAARLLLAHMAGNAGSIRAVTIAVELITRGSTAPPRPPKATGAASSTE